MNNSSRLYALRVGGYVVTVEGTWYEVSNGVEVVAYGNCAEGTTTQEVYDLLKARGDI